ncbi:lipopolysaccharide biosynthesis protein [Fictibacillus nanhaiensis]|uniref:lipopolysaccharide biosynthesis protein n=1 Tax=Fictibacillus nanhaiensis TaxID=742169 RepID=UPI003C1EA7EA
MKKFLNDKGILNIILGFSLASWISALINFAVLPVSTRYFEPSELAKINLFFIICTVILPLVSLGLDQGYMRFFHESKTRQAKKELFYSCLFTGIIVLIISTAVAFPFRKNISVWITNEENNFILISLFLCILNMLVLRYFSLLHRMNNSIILFTATSIFSLPVLKVSSLVAALYDSKYYTAIIFIAITSFVTLLMTFLLSKSNISRISITRTIKVDILRFSLPLMPITVIALLNNNIPLFLIRTLDNMSNLGIYSTAVTLVGIITLLQSGLNMFWSPYVYKRYEQESSILNIRKIQKFVVFAMVAFSILIIMFQDLIILLLGEEYRIAVSFIPFLLVSPVCYTVAETTGIGIALKKKSYINLYIYLVNIFINVLFCYLLIPYFGLQGAAISSAISSISMLILKTYFGQKYYKSMGRYKDVIVGMSILIIVTIINVIIFNEYIHIFINLIALIFMVKFFGIVNILRSIIRNQK